MASSKSRHTWIVVASYVPLQERRGHAPADNGLLHGRRQLLELAPGPPCDTKEEPHISCVNARKIDVENARKRACAYVPSTVATSLASATPSSPVK